MNLVRITSVPASSTSGTHSCLRDPRAPKNSKDAARGVKCHACGRTFNEPANGRNRTAMASSTKRYASIITSDEILFCAFTRAPSRDGNTEPYELTISRHSALGHHPAFRPASVHISDNPEILIEFHDASQRSAAPLPLDRFWQIGISQILKINDVAFLRRIEGFGLDNRILCPIQKNPPRVRSLRCQRDRCFFGLISNCHLSFRINLRFK